MSSFLFFATGALIPVLPYLFGMSGTSAVVVAAVLVGLALIGTGVIVGLLSVRLHCEGRCANCRSATVLRGSPGSWGFVGGGLG